MMRKVTATLESHWKGGKEVAVKVNGTYLSFKDIIRFLAVLAKAEDAKYPHGRGGEMTGECHKLFGIALERGERNAKTIYEKIRRQRPDFNLPCW